MPMQKCTWNLLILSPLDCDSFRRWCGHLWWGLPSTKRLNTSIAAATTPTTKVPVAITQLNRVKISKIFQCSISHVTTSETEIKLFQLPKLFQNYFSDTERGRKHSQSVISLRNNF